MTTTTLIADLEALKTMDGADEAVIGYVDMMVNKAKTHTYHDYKSTQTFPKMCLILHLEGGVTASKNKPALKQALQAMVAKVKHSNDYADEADAQDIAKMKELVNAECGKLRQDPAAMGSIHDLVAAMTAEARRTGYKVGNEDEEKR